ncbi:MAG: 1-hydroxycarotenoid 3,4-desaturase CrtD [Flavobacteriia bacterium]|jgi:phytoene desaturase
MSDCKRKAIVVGSGIAGISAAIRLANKGFLVEVYESNSYPGGKLTVLQLGSYRFDAGPSLFTMPEYVNELFRISGRDPKDYFEYHTCKTACHYFFEDGTFLPFSSDKMMLLDQVGKTLNVDTRPLEKRFEKSAFIYEKTHYTFLESSLHQWKNYFRKEILKTIVAIPGLDIFTTMHKANESSLNHPKLVQIFDRYATYNGSDPYQAPGILNIIPHLEHGIGTYFPKNGMHSITTSLVRLAEELGVQFHYNSKVDEIVEDGRNVKGVKVNETFIPAEVVICNSDVKPAYNFLLKNVKAKKKTLQQEPSSSAMIFYWGIKKKFDQLDLHNIFFSSDYQTEFRHIFKNQTVCDDPTVYIHISSKYVAEDAPDSGENWFVMVNVPSNKGQDWELMRHEIRSKILSKLSRMIGEDIEALIDEEDYLDPIRIEKRTSSFAGALYGASSNDRMAAFFRHPNFSKVEGLYFVGGSVHPGGGIPLCLLSAKIATDLIN